MKSKEISFWLKDLREIKHHRLSRVLMIHEMESKASSGKE